MRAQFLAGEKYKLVVLQCLHEKSLLTNSNGCNFPTN